MSAEATIKQELVAESTISHVKQEVVTPERKRGRKKKSEIVNNTANEEEIAATRPNRRKRLDYSAFLSDDDADDGETTSHKRRRPPPQDNGSPSTTTTNNQENRKKRGDATDEMMNRIFSCMNTAAPIGFDNLIQIPEEDLPPQPVAVRGNSGRSKNRRGRFGKELPDDVYSSTQETVTCGRCNLLMDGDSWKSHKSNFHNELAWKLGEPPIVISCP